MLVSLLHQTLTAADVILPERNDMTALPDSLEIQVLDFYNAGLLTGVDQYGFFRINGTVTRGQAAAILARVIDPSLRVRFTPVSFDLCRDVLLADPEATVGSADSCCSGIWSNTAAPYTPPPGIWRRRPASSRTWIPLRPP